MRPTISVVMSVYNSEDSLKESILSVLNQSFKDFEFIIINDRSKDGSLAVMRGFAKKDNRIKLVNNKKNIGLTKSLNKGLSMSRGKFIARIDADDLCLPERFNIQANFLKSHPDIFLLGSGCLIRYAGNDYSNDFVSGQAYIHRLLPRENVIPHSSIMFRNDKKIRYREKFYYSQDYDLYLNLLTSGLKVDAVGEPLIIFRVSDKAISATKAYIQKSFASMAQEFYNQRLKKGKDDYDNFDKEKLMNIKAPANSKYSNYNSVMVLIDTIVVSNKLPAARLLWKHKRDLPAGYVVRKSVQLVLPKALSRLKRKYLHRC